MFTNRDENWSINMGTNRICSFREGVRDELLEPVRDANTINENKKQLAYKTSITLHHVPYTLELL